MTNTADQKRKLRANAEAYFAAISAKDNPKHESLDQAMLIQELQIHQIEMEMQNESLKQAHAELEVAHNRYQDLYELSPVGYLTLTPGVLHGKHRRHTFHESRTERGRTPQAG